MIEVIYVKYAFLDHITVAAFQIGSDCDFYDRIRFDYIFSNWIESRLFGFGPDQIRIQNVDKISDSKRPI